MSQRGLVSGGPKLELRIQGVIKQMLGRAATGLSCLYGLLSKIVRHRGWSYKLDIILVVLASAWPSLPAYSTRTRDGGIDKICFYSYPSETVIMVALYKESNWEGTK